MGLPFLESPSNSASPWRAPFFFGLPQLLCNDFAQCGSGDPPPKGADQSDLLLHTQKMPHSDSLGQADHSDLPIQVNLNGAFVWCARADETDLLLWLENHHPHTVQSHCTATVATQRKMGHTMEMQNLMEIPKMAAPLPQS